MVPILPIGSTAPLSVVSTANLLGVHSIPLPMLLIMMLKSTSPETDLLEDTTHDQPLLGCRATDNPLATKIQPTHYPPNSPAFKTIYLQFRDKDVVQDHVKSLAHVQIDCISCPSFVHTYFHYIVEGHQIVIVNSVTSSSCVFQGTFKWKNSQSKGFHECTWKRWYTCGVNNHMLISSYCWTWKVLVLIKMSLKEQCETASLYTSKYWCQKKLSKSHFGPALYFSCMAW